MTTNALRPLERNHPCPSSSPVPPASSAVSSSRTCSPAGSRRPDRRGRPPHRAPRRPGVPHRGRRLRRPRRCSPRSRAPRPCSWSPAASRASASRSTHAHRRRAAAGVRRVVYTSAPHARHERAGPRARAQGHRGAAPGVRPGVDHPAEQLVHGELRRRARAGADDGRPADEHRRRRVATASRDDFGRGRRGPPARRRHDGRVYELTRRRRVDVRRARRGRRRRPRRPGGSPTCPPTSTARSSRRRGSRRGHRGFVATLDADIRRGDLADATADLRTLIGRPTTPLVDGLRAALGPQSAAAARAQVGRPAAVQPRGSADESSRSAASRDGGGRPAQER